MSNFASVDDVILLWKPITEAEQPKVEALLSIISNELRLKAETVGKDLDQMIEEDAKLADIAKSVTIDVLRRYINDSAEDMASMSQMSQSAGGYSVSGTFLVAGGGVFIKKQSWQG